MEYNNPCSKNATPTPWNTLILKVKLNQGAAVAIELPDNASVADLKRSVEKRCGINPRDQFLFHGLPALPLVPDEYQGAEGERVTLSYLGVGSGSYITVEVNID